MSRAFRREIGDRRISGRAFAREIGKSEKYTRDRLNDVYEFGLDDIAAFCELIGTTPQEFFKAIERDAANVGGTTQPEGSSATDADDYALAASDRPTFETEQEREQEQP
ncbi:hypothetical protein DEI95_13220 [Curtobacterium sp. MCBD17_008]|nr:hypothetical protein DEI95_13220 [Curtobacterium sp. MCBD17_008]